GIGLGTGFGLQGLDADLLWHGGDRVAVLDVSASLALDARAATAPRPAIEQEPALARFLLGDLVAAGDLEELALERFAGVERAGSRPVRQRIEDPAGQLRKPERERARRRLRPILHLRGVEIAQDVRQCSRLRGVC